MLSLSNLDVAETLTKFKNRGIPVGFIVPTDTGLLKSIMDAHDSLRRVFVKQKIHNYEEQSKGSANKKLLDTLLFCEKTIVETTTSLYRPESKNGDPRIWIYKLSAFASAGDLVAICPQGNGLVVINCSTTDIESLFSPKNIEFTRLFPMPVEQVSLAAGELLAKLATISSQGYINTLRQGDTGVGYTLETLLGIQANSSRAPDYKGIELKASRASRLSNRQTTVFSQVPNWALSNLKGSKAILDRRGRYNPDKERTQLFHEISCTKPNSYGLQLQIADDWEKLYQIYVPGEGVPTRETDVVWLMDKLIDRVDEKHQETMWVSAETRGKREAEEFWYKDVKHTTGVDPTSLPILLEAGAMTVHYLIKETPSGGAKDQGYLFKMAPKYLPTLFANTVSYDLSLLH